MAVKQVVNNSAVCRRCKGTGVVSVYDPSLGVERVAYPYNGTCYRCKGTGKEPGAKPIKDGTVSKQDQTRLFAAIVHLINTTRGGNKKRMVSPFELMRLMSLTRHQLEATLSPLIKCGYVRYRRFPKKGKQYIYYGISRLGWEAWEKFKKRDNSAQESDIIKENDTKGGDVVSGKAVLEYTCRLCKKKYMIEVSIEDYKRLLIGDGNIQDIFPYLSPGERELMINGICGECFDKTL